MPNAYRMSANTLLSAILITSLSACGGGSGGSNNSNPPLADQAVTDIVTPDDAAAYFSAVLDLSRAFQISPSKAAQPKAPNQKTVTTTDCNSGYYTEDDETNRRVYVDCEWISESGSTIQRRVLNGPETQRVPLPDSGDAAGVTCGADTGTQYGEPSQRLSEYTHLQSDDNVRESLLEQNLLASSTFELETVDSQNYQDYCIEFDGVRENDNLRDSLPAAVFEFGQLVLHSRERAENSGFIESQIDGDVALNLGELEAGCPIGPVTVETVVPLTTSKFSYVTSAGEMLLTDSRGETAHIEVVQASENAQFAITVSDTTSTYRYFDLISNCDGFY
jgi:hypothetical protein